MMHCTYYDLLGVSPHASMEELSEAKTFLVKKFHPDANLDNTFDTTLYIQRILEAYNTLSNPDSRRQYDRRLNGYANPRKRSSADTSEDFTSTQMPSFAPFWEAANKLNELVKESMTLFQKQAKAKRNFLNNHFFHKTKQAVEQLGESSQYEEELIMLAHLAAPHIAILLEADIPKRYWFSDIMNWILLQWSRNRDLDFHLLFAMYDTFLQNYQSESEQNKRAVRNKAFLSNLEKLLEKQLE